MCFSGKATEWLDLKLEGGGAISHDPEKNEDNICIINKIRW
jgi:hypothetical protein